MKVNGEILTKTDLETRQVQALRARGSAIDLATEKGNTELRKALNEVTPGLLVSSVDEMLLVQRGKELGYKLSDEQFKRVLDNLKTQNKIETDEQLQAALKPEGMTMTDLRRNMERQMLYSNVQQVEVFGRVAVTEDEAHKYYDSHTSEFTTPSSIMLREILVAVPADPRGINAAADEAAKAKAEGIRARVAAGEPFARIAADLSDAASKANGGLLGPLNATDLSADFKKLIEGLKPGQITPVVRTQRGYQVLQLESATQVPDAALRSGARADQRTGGHRQAPGRVPEIHHEAPRAGDHRVEERRREEGLRGRDRRTSQGARRRPDAAP